MRSFLFNLTRNRWKRGLQRLHPASCGVLLGFACVPGCSDPPKPAAPDANADSSASGTKEASDTADTKVDQLVDVEDLVLDLTPRLRAIGAWYSSSCCGTTGGPPPELGTLRIVRGLSAIDVDSVLRDSEHSMPLSVESGDWPTAMIEPQVGEPPNPWRPLQSLVGKWTFGGFGVVSARFDKVNPNKFLMETLFRGGGNAKSKGGDEADALGFRATQQLVWARRDGKWQLDEWQQGRFTLLRSPHPLFEEVLDEAIPDEAARKQARRSYHDESLLVALKTGETPIYDRRYAHFMSPESPHALPSVSVVDFDSDGWDDLFISARWGPTQMLRNQGDGTFKDVTEEVGLKVPGLVNCSVFVDIDNDGDKDALLGRSLEAAMYFRNDGGKFRDVTEQLTNLRRTYMVSAIAVSDINRDGLLDFYFSTYGPAGDNPSVDWKKIFVHPKYREKLTSMESSQHMWLDYAGPPNLVVMNRGNGRLEKVEPDDAVAQWHHSYQAAWGDHDGDGDDDLYICNDFAAGGFLRNETPQGASTPKLVEAVRDVFPGGTMGFGMGVSWADYDVDGDLDLYVSNMYSKAGTRILKQVGNSDPRMLVSAKGNFLYGNTNGTFQQLAGSDDDELHVDHVGWSFGGQFADFDNNGSADLYVPSGYFTPPQEAATQVDL